MCTHSLFFTHTNTPVSVLMCDREHDRQLTHVFLSSWTTSTPPPYALYPTPITPAPDAAIWVTSNKYDFAENGGFSKERKLTRLCCDDLISRPRLFFGRKKISAKQIFSVSKHRDRNLRPIKINRVDFNEADPQWPNKGQTGGWTLLTRPPTTNLVSNNSSSCLICSHLYIFLNKKSFFCFRIKTR